MNSAIVFEENVWEGIHYQLGTHNCMGKEMYSWVFFLKRILIYCVVLQKACSLCLVRTPSAIMFTQWTHLEWRERSRGGPRLAFWACCEASSTLRTTTCVHLQLALHVQLWDFGRVRGTQYKLRQSIPKLPIGCRSEKLARLWVGLKYAQ